MSRPSSRNVKQPNVPLLSLAARCRAARHARGLSQIRLAELSGTTQAALTKIERGLSTRPRRIEAIAEALGVPPEWLMFGVIGEPATLSDAVAHRKR